MKLGAIATGVLITAFATIVLPVAMDAIVGLVLFGVGYAYGKGIIGRETT